jgi:hypothetical protein
MSRGTKLSKRRKQEKINSKMSVIFTIILIVAVAGIGWYFFDEFSFRSDYNAQVIELDRAFESNDSKAVGLCTESLERLYKSNSSDLERAEPLKEHLIKCYRYFTRNPSLPLKVQVGYLEKLQGLAPKSLTMLDKKLLENLK